MFNSDAKQDQFVANLLGFKKNGTYIDIGSCHSIISNNTYYFSMIGWSGICVEIDDRYTQSYESRRNSVLLTEDALKIDYLSLFKSNNIPNRIDYLSLDIDTNSLDVLSILPLDIYRFGIITIEHDSYLYGDEYKSKQRDILIRHGYMLICSDVFVQQPGFNTSNCSFEDWWVDPNDFDINLLNKIKSDHCYPSDIISKF